MSKRGNSIGYDLPNQIMEEQPMIPWERIDESYPDDLDNSEVEDSNGMKESENEHQPAQEKDQPTIISLKLPKKVGSFYLLLKCYVTTD